MLQQLHWSGRATISAALGFLAATSVSADEHPGNLWKTTSQMTMQGMEMPANTVELCTAEDWNEPPPPPPDQACTQTFETPDSYTGTITFTAQGMTMTVQLQGEKIGECDNPIN
jgi:hypothetical protein